MTDNDAYELVHLANGAWSMRSREDGETFHPGIGPVAEAESLYVRQLRLIDRLNQAQEEFVIWDVGLGGGANALTAIRLLGQNANPGKTLRICSFDRTLMALEFALGHANELQYPLGFEDAISTFCRLGTVEIQVMNLKVRWEWLQGDFPSFLASHRSKSQATSGVPAPHAIFFDPHSPRKNPAMWTVDNFEALHACISPQRACSLANFTRSTLGRTAMLLGGFFVGVGSATGEKEETTLAASVPGLAGQLLDARWLNRAMRSDSAEPLRSALYTRKPLSAATLAALRAHPQFSGTDQKY